MLLQFVQGLFGRFALLAGKLQFVALLVFLECLAALAVGFVDCFLAEDVPAET